MTWIQCCESITHVQIMVSGQITPYSVLGLAISFHIKAKKTVQPVDLQGLGIKTKSGGGAVRQREPRKKPASPY